MIQHDHARLAAEDKNCRRRKNLPSYIGATSYAPGKILHHTFEARWRLELCLGFIGVLRVHKLRHLATRAFEGGVVGRKLEDQLVNVARPQGEAGLGLVDIAVSEFLSAAQHCVDLVVFYVDREVWFALTFQGANPTNSLASNAWHAKGAHIKIRLTANAKPDYPRAWREEVGVLENEHVRQPLGQPCFDGAGKVQQRMYIAVPMRPAQDAHGRTLSHHPRGQSAEWRDDAP